MRKRERERETEIQLICLTENAKQKDILEIVIPWIGPFSIWAMKKET